MWPETARLLRKRGSAAFWVCPTHVLRTCRQVHHDYEQIYSEFRVAGQPLLTPLIKEYAQGSDPENSLGPHWQQPGRSILDNHLVQVPSATSVLPDKFSDFERVFFTGAST